MPSALFKCVSVRQREIIDVDLQRDPDLAQGGLQPQFAVVIPRRWSRARPGT